MKVNGKTVNGQNRIVSVIIPVGDDAVEFLVRPLTKEDDFEKMVPLPTPPIIIKPNIGRVKNIEDPAFKAAVTRWATQEAHYKFLKAVDQTVGLEWDKVRMDDPNTYHLWEEEMNESIGRGAANYLFGKAVEANSLTEEVLEKARARFLADRVAASANLISQSSELTTTPSGEPANG